MFGARRRFLVMGLSAASIALYTVLVGATASVVRAGLMGGLSLFARTVGRRQDGLNSLAFVSAVMALANPLVLGDAGFQLSFTATLGLILYADPVSAAFNRFASCRLPLDTAHRLAGPVGGYPQPGGWPGHRAGDRPAAGGERLRPANPPEWIDALNPQLILLSVSATDRRGLPSPETLEAVQ